MLDTPNIYGDPIISRKRRGVPIDPFKNIKESIVIEKYYALLTEIPNRLDRVKVTGLEREFHEVEKGFLNENTFKVDYTNGIVYFHDSLAGRTLNFEYTGEGVFLFPDSRVYLTGDKGFPTVRDKFADVDRAILVERNRITEQIISHPQPSETVDLRIDYNGKVYKVAKDRVDAEQRKIEEAYVDAKNVRFGSLKKRIDSLQIATEESFDEQDIINTNIWAEIGLVPGKITLETGRLEQKLNGEISKLTSQISLIPEQIRLNVQELKEWSTGEFSKQSSTLTMLSNKMELKVDVNGAVSAINLSKEGVKIQGNKIHITGQTKIDDAVITSAMIKDLTADKIRAGVIRSQNDNITWNLNTGQFSMGNADMILSGGAKIRFTDSGNRILYTQVDPETGDNHTAGFGVGRNINRRFPFSYLGSSKGSNVHATDASNFTGFIANTDARTEIDNIGNSVVGDVFHIREKAVAYREGFRFDLRDSVVNVFRPINTHLADYDMGTPTARFRNTYTDNIRSNSTVNIRDSHRTSGWMIQTRYSGDGSAITLRGLNGGDYNYSIGGRATANQRIRSIFLRNKPNVSSDARLKEKISVLELGLDLITILNPASFRFKRTNGDKKANKLEFGFIAQDVRKALEIKNIDLSEHSILSVDDDGYYALEHEQFIAPMVNSIKELNNKDKDKDRRITELEKEVQELKIKLEIA